MESCWLAFSLPLATADNVTHYSNPDFPMKHSRLYPLPRSHFFFTPFILKGKEKERLTCMHVFFNLILFSFCTNRPNLKGFLVKVFLFYFLSFCCFPHFFSGVLCAHTAQRLALRNGKTEGRPSLPFMAMELRPRTGLTSGAQAAARDTLSSCTPLETDAFTHPHPAWFGEVEVITVMCANKTHTHKATHLRTQFFRLNFVP